MGYGGGRDGGLNEEGYGGGRDGEEQIPKMIIKLSLVNKEESSRESKNMISTRERKFLGRGILIVFILYLSV